MTYQHEPEAVLAQLRESRLSSDERRKALDTFRTAIEALEPQTLSSIASTAIRNSPNDVRRVALQILSSRIESDSFREVTDGHSQEAVSELMEAIEGFLRTTLKIQSTRALSTTSRPTLDIASLSISSLRATAAALKTLHALIRLASSNKGRAAISSSQSVARLPGLLALFDIILPCLSAGARVSRPATGSISRSSSSLQVGAFSWNNSSALKRTQSSSIKLDGDASSESPAFRRHEEDLSADETDRKSDKSESERSDFSSASVITASSRSRKDESRLQEATTKLIRQNALHCLIELNRRESRALISRWSELLPDQPAPLNPQSATATPSSASRFPASSSTSTASFSLCTLITQDASTSVRIAAMETLGSLLTLGSQQLSIAQERAQRALSFTSLSSQLASWIVNIRTYLVVALQRAATAQRASAKAEASVGLTRYPSLLTVALLQLARTFVGSTAKAKLVTPNAMVLGPVVTPFASHSDPQVQAEAKRLIAAISPTSVAARDKAQGLRGFATRMDSTISSSGAENSASSQTSPFAEVQSLDLTNLISEGITASPETCNRVLTLLEAADNPVAHLSTWSVLVKHLAEPSAPQLDSQAPSRVIAMWQRLCSESRLTSDQLCTLLSTIPDLYGALSRHSRLDSPVSSVILQYVERCCASNDEGIRAAAVRVFGLLVLPSDTTIKQDDQPQRAISETLHVILWGRGDTKQTGALHDNSTLVRQRAAWTFSNLVEARFRSSTHIGEHEWIAQARYCLEAGKDIEGVAVSACRASGHLLALLQPALASSSVCRSLGRSLLEQLCRVLGTTSKPPKSRWNAASALDRALCSDVVLTALLDEALMDRVLDLLCSNLDAKVYKVRVSAANALVSLCKSESASRRDVPGERRLGRIRKTAAARLAELQQPTQSKEATLYLEELRRLLDTLLAST
ncbi:hypothetical protein PHSY_000114 [Pseudozyma hubeiensis SY62]|uniref:DUF4042 domain-containing protein n=1 Tax=Pseudozyma hubeiensis (strain SY62) TaxID=1305764 RepID=R9P376_PSEHS|nr:hypothetical protein PHSY_000114 [Pseudozyma hubeiensis SY62]GAC92560.1 hypothetical protein PHSY_000114 [Pseudozyma hubeiensis SY62]